MTHMLQIMEMLNRIGISMHFIIIMMRIDLFSLCYRGFGHIAVMTKDVYAACDKLESNGVLFQKKPDEGRMKGKIEKSNIINVIHNRERSCICEGSRRVLD